jgi:hypothetical protein
VVVVAAAIVVTVATVTVMVAMAAMVVAVAAVLLLVDPVVVLARRLPQRARFITELVQVTHCAWHYDACACRRARRL